jgi:hypothetical protein
MTNGMWCCGANWSRTQPPIESTHSGTSSVREITGYLLLPVTLGGDQAVVELGSFATL